MQPTATTPRLNARDLGVVQMREIYEAIEPQMKALGFKNFDAEDVRIVSETNGEVFAAIKKISDGIGVEIGKCGKTIAAVLRRSPNLVQIGKKGPGRCTRFAFRGEPAATPLAAPERPAVSAGDSLTLLEAAIRGAAEAVIVEVRKLMAGGPKQ